MCAVLLPLGVNPIAVNKYIKYQINTKYEWEINPQDFGRRTGRDDGDYSSKARPKNVSN